jgi:hypothetical protein
MTCTTSTSPKRLVRKHKPFTQIQALVKSYTDTSRSYRSSEAVVGWLGVALTLVLVTGAYLWWPGIRKMAIGFKVIFNRGDFLKKLKRQSMAFSRSSLPLFYFRIL